MPADPAADPWSGTTYNGFSGVAAPPDTRRRAPGPAGRRPSTRTLMLGGLGAAVGLGVLFGLLARPELKPEPDLRPAAPMAAVTVPDEAPLPAETLPPPEQVTIEVNPQLAPEAQPRPAGKIEVLPRERARIAPRPQVSAPPAPRPSVAPAPAPLAVAPPPAPVIRPAPAPPPVVEPARAEQGPSFNCRYARSRSERMVCDDAQLASADRRLARAYDRAVASGIPARELRADQDDWLEIREDAARYGRGAVNNVYEQRIRELNNLAD